MNKFVDACWNGLTCALIALVTIAAVCLISGFPVKWAWNASMPAIFKLPEITFWQAFSLVWLAAAFFKAGPRQAEKK